MEQNMRRWMCGTVDKITMRGRGSESYENECRKKKRQRKTADANQMDIWNRMIQK